MTMQGQKPTDPSIAWQNIVVPDPVALRFLQQDACVQVVQSKTILRGYELYVVEQWACSRQSPTIVVVTFTGDETHSIHTGVIAVPRDQGLWSPRLRVYLTAAHQHHARAKQTKLGEIVVTNLSNFPSALTVIPVPDGDVSKHRQLFFVNEDLKRLGCSGRSGLILSEPAEATQTKFQQLYRTSDRIPFWSSVTELVKLCQVALYLFDKLDYEYIDGLLCDMTETAIGNWWTELGAEHYNFEPSDGILGPCTVAALLGMLMGARNRLHWYGAPVSKDVFDIESTKRGIGYFQKQQKLEKNRRLDRQTLFRLHKATAKAVAADGWGVQKAVKSTVSEIGGKRGEIVLDMVSRDKGGIADIETLDMDTFVHLVYGERPKWLWHGKARRTPAEMQEFEFGTGNTMLSRNETTGQVAKRSQSLPLDEELEAKKDETLNTVTGLAGPSFDNSADREASKKAVFKSVAGKMSDRIKDAVGGGRRGQAGRQSTPAKEEEAGGAGIALSNTSQAILASSPVAVGRVFTWRPKAEDDQSAMRRSDAPTVSESSRGTGLSALDDKLTSRSTDMETALDNKSPQVHQASPPQVSTQVSAQISAQADGKDDNGCGMPSGECKVKPQRPTVFRRRSCHVSDISCKHVPNENRWARHMSFGDAQAAILTWEEIVDFDDATDGLEVLDARAAEAERLSRLVNGMEQAIGPWVEDKVKAIEALNERYARDTGELQELYQQMSEACNSVRHSSDDLLASQRATLTESVKEVEVLVARLEYEMDNLDSKVRDVDDGIENFKRLVEGVEERAEELKTQLETESWLHWLVRTMTGVGTGPNVTRGAP
ncbi:hypothetical protein CDD82_5656 [Ophiocordyceps australis]|uniref:STB6-like N-terminal domain-containing protein n=1 Tax=Ophiocordyceps australis TaxID=1399860 RepID=A0A2C5Z0G1_9HYPO|nr:hypothetical protein CDD82_5656 [Ophiocordyceps australis]